MKIKDEIKTGLEEKFVDNAEVGDVIKVHYIAADHIQYLLLVNNVGCRDYLFVDISDFNRVESQVGVTLNGLYKSTFVTPEGGTYIDSLEVYKNASLTIK